MFIIRYWMGATKTEDDVVRWMSNNQPVNPNLTMWANSPNEDAGQFYATKGGVSCLLMDVPILSWLSDPEWGYITENLQVLRREYPTAKALCERKQT